MDVNLRKTATDTAYIVVGVGVLGFQQAQVRRRDAQARVATLRREARDSLRARTDRIKARTGGCASNLGSLRSNVTNTARRVAPASTLRARSGLRSVGDTVGAVGAKARAGADAARNADPLGWVDPVVGDLRLRVEPVVEQIRTITLPDSVSALPDQVSKVIEVGRNRVQGLRGDAADATPARAAANGTTAGAVVRDAVPPPPRHEPARPPPF
jgi:hypothetical protein